MSKTVSVRDMNHFGLIRYAAQDALAQAGLTVKLSHANEAAARGLAHRTLAALTAALKNGAAACAIDDAGFRARLTEFGYASAPEGLFERAVAVMTPGLEAGVSHERCAGPDLSSMGEEEVVNLIVEAIENGEYERISLRIRAAECSGGLLEWEEVRNDLHAFGYADEVYEAEGLPTLRIQSEVNAYLDADDVKDASDETALREAARWEYGNSDSTLWNERVSVDGFDDFHTSTRHRIEQTLVEHAEYGDEVAESLVRVLGSSIRVNEPAVEEETEEDAWARYEGYCDRVQVVTGIHQTGGLMIGEETIVTDPRDVLMDIDPREPGHREWWEDYGRRHHDATVALTEIGSMLTELTGDSRVLARAAEEVFRAGFAETSDSDYESETANLENLVERWGMLTDLDALRADEAVTEKAKAMAWPEIAGAIAEAITYADIDGIADAIADAVTADGLNGVESSVIGSVRIAALVTKQAEAVIDDFDLADDATVLADEAGIDDDEIRARALTEARRRIRAAVHERLGAGLDRAVPGIGSDSVAF